MSASESAVHLPGCSRTLPQLEYQVPLPCSQVTPVAVKQLKAEACLDPAALRSFEEEFSIAAKLRHHAICALYGTTVLGGAPAIVLEYMPGGSLHHALHNRRREEVLKPDALAHIALDVAMGIAYLHSSQVIHRDVKAANVLLTAEGHAKVTDFGIATRFGPEHTAETGTYRFMAPEVISHQQYDMRCDTYSFGMLLWEMMHGEIPFRGQQPLQVAFSVALQQKRPPIELRKPLKGYGDVIQACWDQQPDLRPTMQQVVQQLNVQNVSVKAAIAAERWLLESTWKA